MWGERGLLRAGGFLVGRAARRLPAAVRDERRREWAAELPVILGDPEVRPAAVRAVRMLWFAADTVRGAALGRAALGRGPVRHRGAHRRPVGKNDVFKSARWLAVGVALFAGMATSLAVLAFLVYETIFGVNLPYYVAFLLISPVGLARFLPGWRPGGPGPSWFYAGAMASATGQLVNGLAGQLRWGHPWLFTLISYCGSAVCAVCLSVAVVIGIRSARRSRRADLIPKR